VISGPVLTARDVIKTLNVLGFVEIRQKGSHKQFRHLDGRQTTVPCHPGRDISPILLRQIAKDIGTTFNEFISIER
jgi:predicted RNA binding protein YcfA (HicA-like mRNA interferase family)